MGKKQSAKKKTAKIRGQMRKDHFSSGGSAKEWRGVSSVHKSKKDKKKNRSVEKKGSIKESSD